MSSPPFLQAVLAAADAAAARAAAAAGCSPRALKACVGTALAVVAVHRLLTSRRGAAEEVAPVAAQGDGPSPAPLATRAAPPASPAASRPPARVCVATPGVVFAGPADVLAEGAQSVGQQAARAVAALAAVADVYLITQVAPGDGAVRAEAAARESLIAAGVVGSRFGAVPPHRALFCTTQVGRIALVRQIVTDAQGVHVDGCTEAVRELARFGTRLVHVADASDSSDAGSVPGTQAVASLREWLTVSWPGL